MLSVNWNGCWRLCDASWEPLPSFLTAVSSCIQPLSSSPWPLQWVHLIHKDAPSFPVLTASNLCEVPTVCTAENWVLKTQRAPRCIYTPDSPSVAEWGCKKGTSLVCLAGLGRARLEYQGWKVCWTMVLPSNTSSVGSHLIELPFSFPPLQRWLERSASLDQCGSSNEVEQVHKIWTV